MANLKRSSLISIAGLALAAAIFLLYGFAYQAKANPLDLITSNTTATTSLAYMTPGTATTTYYFDSYANGSADQNATDKAMMLLQLVASSTSSSLKWQYEFSQGVTGVDCSATPSACDWYSDTIQSQVTATSTQTFNVTAPIAYQWNFASTSQNGASVAATNNRGLKVIQVPTPARYTRVIFSVPVGATNAAVWATFLEQKQQP